MASRTEPDIISKGNGGAIIAGQDELLIWANRKPDTTEEHIDAINTAIAVYVKARVQLESDRSIAQWNLVNNAQVCQLYANHSSFLIDCCSIPLPELATLSKMRKYYKGELSGKCRRNR